MDYSKEVNANDVVDRERSRANDVLKKARTMAKNNSMQGIEEHLDKAEKAFTDLKPLI
jgi:flagellin-specific chaperone FliS